MTVTPYASEDQFRARLAGLVDDATAGIDQDSIVLALTSATKWIDGYCRRSFVVPADEAEPETRTFRVPTGEHLWVDDIADPESVVVEGGRFGGTFTAWATEVELLPDRCPPEWPGDWPRTHLASPLTCWDYVWEQARRIQVTALWGVPVVPDGVVEACLILATKFWKRKGSPEGVAGWNDYGVIRLRGGDPDVDDLLTPYRRLSDIT